MSNGFPTFNIFFVSEAPKREEKKKKKTLSEMLKEDREVKVLKTLEDINIKTGESAHAGGG